MKSLREVKGYLIGLSIILLSACITLPGHREVIKQDNYLFTIKAPSKQVKKEIQFNPEQTGIIFLPKNTSIELRVIENSDTHRLNIKNAEASIDFKYSLNGRTKDFGQDQQKWFAELLPQIISQSSLK